MSQNSPEYVHVKQLVYGKVSESPIYTFLFRPLQILSVRPGTVIARLVLDACHMNSGGSLHGSVSATIVDFMGGIAIASVGLRKNTGVSIDIHVTYQSGAKAGEEIEIEAIAEKVGGSLAFTRVNIFSVVDSARGKVVAAGTHTKYIKEKAIPKP